MPQSGQIVPQYQHPYTATYINDNTVFTDITAPAVNGIRSIFVFASQKGRDGKLLKFSSITDFLEEYGNPNFKLFGQPNYMPYAALNTGVVEAFCMRVMPSDAAYANLVIIAKVKVVTDSGTTPVNKLQVRFEAYNHTNVTSKKDLINLTELMLDETPDTDGYKTYPLYVVNYQGRGACGNAFRIRMVSSAQMDKENNYKNYQLDVYEVQNTLQQKESFIGSVYPDALDSDASLFFDDVVNDDENGSKKIEISVIPDSFQSIFDLYSTDVDPSTDLTIETFDLFTGTDKTTGDALSNITFATSETGYIALDTPAGVPFGGGADGSFDYNTADLSTREEAMNNAYISAFNGDFDLTIRSKRRAPADVLFDAGYADEVKTALVSFATKRYDAMLYLDAGLLTTISDALTWGTSMKNVADRIISKHFQSFKIRDPFSGKNVSVTYTYYMAQQLPLHLKNNGNHIPFVGVNYTVLSGAIKNTLQPFVDADDEDTKEKLYLLKLNYVVAQAENTYIRGTQGTAQNIMSDLSEENNVLVLLEIKRALENMVSALTYNFADPAEQARFKKDGDRLINPYRGIKLQDAVIDFKMSDWEKQRSILHCYLAIICRTLDKRNIVEIDINPR